MRPRVFPAEDPGARANAYRVHACFNEAAGIPRGRPDKDWISVSKKLMLQ